MRHSENKDSLIFDAVDYCIRELTKQATSNVVYHDCSGKRLSDYVVKSLPETPKKAQTKIAFSLFIESCSSLKFVLGIFMDFYFKHRRRSRASRIT